MAVQFHGNHRNYNTFTTPTDVSYRGKPSSRESLGKVLKKYILKRSDKGPKSPTRRQSSPEISSLSEARVLGNSWKGRQPHLTVSGKRRVTFSDIHQLPDVEGLDRLEEEVESRDNGDENKSPNIGMKVVVDGSPILSARSDEESPNESSGHVNALFEPDKVQEPPSRNFVKRFGKKGKELGDFNDATDIVYMSRHRTLITDLINGRVQLCNGNGKTTMVYHGDEIAEPWSVALTLEGYIAVTSQRRKCVVILNSDGDIVKMFGKGFFQKPSGIAVMRDGRYVVTDILADRVSIHEKDGTFMHYLGDSNNPRERFAQPRYVCCSAIDDIIVSDSGNHCVKVFTADGKLVHTIGKFGSNDGALKCPYAVCTDKYSDILVADHYNKRVSMFSRNGTFIRHVVTSANGLIHPKGLSLTSDLTLYITHGNLKATEVLVYRMDCGPTGDGSAIITHV